jgi:3-oxoacyl-[acyl-carrier protein] reductase
MNSPAAFHGKVALIAGGSRGIGAAVARRFSSQGAQVVICFKSNRNAAEEVVADIVAAGGSAIAFEADIVDPTSVARLMNEVLARFNCIDILVNTAGIAPYRPLGSLDASHIREVFDTNVLGALLLTQAVAPHMPSPGGRIIHFSSRLAVSPIASSSVYAAAKAAVSTLTHALSKELGPKGITINAVAPGVIETDMTSAIIQERGESIRMATPLGRIGTTDDIASIVTFLASPDSGWITGRTILADGGMS